MIFGGKDLAQGTRGPRGATVRGSSLVILPPHRQIPEQPQARPASGNGRQGCWRATGKNHSDLLRGGSPARNQRPASAPSASGSPLSGRPSLGSYKLKDAGNHRPSTAQRAAEDIVSKDKVGLKSAAFLARGTDYICSNFDAPGTKPTGRGLPRSSSTPAMPKRRDLGKPGEAIREGTDYLRSSIAAPEGNAKPAIHKRSPLGSKLDEADSEDQKVRDLARTLNLPRDDMAAACDLFKRHAEISGATSFLDGRLTEERFAGVLREITGRKDWGDLSPDFTNVKFRRADKNSGGALDFSDFAIWFSSRSFYEDFNLDAGQRSLRKLARKYDMPYSEVEQYKKSFDHFDTDQSGAIQKTEFQHLLCKLSKVPESIGIPPARVQELWSDADVDKHGDIDFREFLLFYRKYFDTRGGGGAGFEDYYRSVRKLHAPKR